MVTTATHPMVRPAADLIETADAWLIRLDMPGVDESTTEITLEDGVLTISGTNTLTLPEGSRSLHTEFAIADYRRAFTLSKAVDQEDIQATVRNGVVTVRLAKTNEVKPRRINVNVG